jgi:hypothetical protein
VREDFVEGWIIALSVLIVIGLIALSIYQAHKRRKALEAWARSRGFSFSADYDYAIQERYADFGCLNQGSAQYAYNVIRGTPSRRTFCGFDYHYETYSTDSKGNRETHHHYFSAVIVDSGLPLKTLYLRSEGFFDRVAEFLGFDDIDFESREFSKAFHVKAPDKRWAYDVLHQETMEYLLQAPRFDLEFQAGQVIAYRGSTFDPAEFDAALDLIHGILDRLPRSVLQELKGAD